MDSNVLSQNCEQKLKVYVNNYTGSEGNGTWPDIDLSPGLWKCVY